MKRAPLILIGPSVQRHGMEFSDCSLSLSDLYASSIFMAGGVPWVLPCLVSEELAAEAVRRCDGVLLTGGEDVQPQLYRTKLPPELKRTVKPAEPQRDLMELLLIQEVFQQRKPLLAICRGMQLLNVALGGTLLVDIRRQRPKALNHSRRDRKDKFIHEIALSPDSGLAKVFGDLHLQVNSSHHQAVDRIPSPLRAVATGPDGIVEGLELRPEDRDCLPYLIAVQFHPERLYLRHPEFRELFCSFVRAAGSRLKRAA